MTIKQELENLSFPQIQAMGEKEQRDLLRRARRATKGRLHTIERRGYAPLVPNFQKLKSPQRLTALSRSEVLSEIRTQRAFLRSETSSAKSIYTALHKAYQKASTSTGKTDTITSDLKIYDPSDVVVETTKKGTLVYRQKVTKKSLRLKYLIDATPVYVAASEKSTTVYTKSQLSKAYQVFHEVYDDPAVRAANLPSNVTRMLVFEVRRGRIKVQRSGKHMTTADIARTITDVYDSYVQDDKDTTLADKSVYAALGSM